VRASRSKITLNCGSLASRVQGGGRQLKQVLRIDDLVDGQKFGRFNFGLLCWSFLAMMADGFDISALASAAPQLARTWHVAPHTFAPALSASLFGILAGAPLLGMMGDRFGRRTSIITGCTIYGLGTLATVWAANLDQIVILRFLTGIGIGGLMPNTIALNSELSPKRLRATLVVLMFTGITTGSGVPGYIQAWLIPRYGWQIMFWIGGLVPLVIAIALRFTLPESIKYLASKPLRQAELIATARRMRRDLHIADDAEFQSAAAAPASGSGLVQLFRGPLRLITPILWVCFATALMANYFLTSWLPLILENSGLSPRESGLATSLYHYGGTIGGLLMSVLLARFGFAVIAVLFLCAVPAIAAIGLPGIPYGAMGSAIALAGFCILGAQFGNNAVSGFIYPTEVRARGVGWALGVGRFGSIAGPLAGGIFIGMKLPQRTLFLCAAAPMMLGLIASVFAAKLWHASLGGVRLAEVS
jgi:MFS transporter, AAHS family, 4-hydroxybenzoate transporter